MTTQAVDRTNSQRKRAGSRRNKKLKNVRTFAKDRECYPCHYHEDSSTYRAVWGYAN